MIGVALVLLMTLTTTPLSVHAATTAPPSVHAATTAPYSLYPPDPYSVFTPVNGSVHMSYGIVAASGQGFDHALQVATLQAPQTPYVEGESSISLAGPTTAIVNQGDALLATFWVRAVTPGPDGSAYSSFQFERNNGPSAQFTTAAIKVGKDWKRYQFPFKAVENFLPGEAQLSFYFGYNLQTLQIGGLSLLNYGPGNPANYPSVTYDGRDPNAAWRADAQARIEKYREGDLNVIVKGSDGQPIPNAAVQVAMQRQAFEFGGAVEAGLLRSNTPDGEHYRAVVSQLFNTVVFGNDLKWPEWEDQTARTDQTLPALEWLNERNFNVRGHNLVWPSWHWLPSDLPALSNDPAALSARVDTHILDETKALRDQVVSWDVLNEPYANHNLMDVLGTQAMAEWFKEAKKGDPQAQLFINDYNNLEHAGERGRQMDFYYNTIQSLLQQKAPVEAIGFQSHFNALQPTSPTTLLQVLNRFSKLDLPMQVTEFDMNTADEQLQADYTRDFMTLIYSYPQITGITEWGGFWDATNSSNTAMYRSDWSQKPNGAVWQDLVRHQWWTDVQGTTNSEGSYKTRGFLGDYNVTATVNGVTKTVHTSLSRDGRTLTIKLDGKPGVLPTPPSNLAVNGGFEAGTVAWTPLGAGANIVKNAHSGHGALQTNSAASGSTQSLLDVHSGTNYTLSGWAKASGKNTTCWIGIEGGKYPGLRTYIQVLPITADHYTHASLSFTVPNNVNWQNAFVWKDTGNGSTTCTFDEITFAPTVGQPPPEPGPPVTLPQLPPESELLANNGFEQGTNSWYCFGGCTLNATSALTHSGNGAAAITHRTAFWQGVGQNVTTQVGNGGTYQASAWVRTATGAGAATGEITLKVATSTGTNYYNLTTAAINENGWTQIQSAPTKINWTGNLQIVEWYTSTTDGTADLLVDDTAFNIIQVAPTTELLSNPGFEQGTNGWYGFGGCTVNATSTPTHSGNGAVAITNRTASWQGVGQNVTAQINNGGTYQTSAWVRTAPGASATTGFITLKVATTTGTNYYNLATAAINENGWTQIQSAPVTISWTGDLQIIEWYVNTSDGTADLLVDDASLTTATV